MSLYQFDAPQSIVMHPRLPKLQYVSSWPTGNLFNPSSIPAREESKNSISSSDLQNPFNVPDLNPWNAASPLLSTSQIPQLNFQNVDLSEGQDSELEEEHNHRPTQASQPRDDNGSDNLPSNTQQQTEIHARKRQKKSTKKFKKAPVSDDEYIEKEETGTVVSRNRTSRKARGRKAGRPPKKDSSNPAKSPARQPARLIRKKPAGIPLPKSLDEAGEPDKMMWKWKNAGKNWDDIRKEWQRLTGHLPGHSTLSVRYIKLNENLARDGAATDHDLCRFKKEAEEELMAQLWNRVAEKMLEHNVGSEHNPKELSKRYNMLVRSGFDPDEMAKIEQSTSQGEFMKFHGTRMPSMFTDEEAQSETIKSAAASEPGDNFCVGTIKFHAGSLDNNFETVAGFPDVQGKKNGIISHDFQSDRTRFSDGSNTSATIYASPLVNYISDSE